MLYLHSLETFGVHDGPGIRLVIFLQGCNFRCLYCQNPDTQPLKSDKARMMSIEEILDRLERAKPYFKDSGGLTASGGEPSLQAKELTKLFKEAQKAGFHTALDTAGTVFSDDIKKLYKYTDLVMLDVKHIDERWHRKITGASNKSVLKCTAYRESTVKTMWLRYVLVPGWTDQPKFLKKWAQTFKNYKSVEKVEILPYHTLGVYKYEGLGRKYGLEGVPPANPEDCKKTKKIFDQYFKNVIIK
ncbi:MAG: pyruvate formate-lyase-activating protein [Candidatus Woesebacteria bacterium]|jgi:pyruvate formate lyase activating enzyme